MIETVIFSLVMLSLFLGLLAYFRGGKWLDTLLYLPVVVSVWLLSVSALGVAKPTVFTIPSDESVQLISVHAVENDRIYVWVILPDTNEPVAYSMPWSLKKMEEIMSGINRSHKGQKVMMDGMFEIQEGELKAYPDPYTAPSTKN